MIVKHIFQMELKFLEYNIKLIKMSIKTAVIYLINLFTNKLNVYISFSLAFILQPIL
jgi:hypothetical protein